MVKPNVIDRMVSPLLIIISVVASEDIFSSNIVENWLQVIR